MVREGLHLVHRDSDPSPVHSLLGELELVRVKDDAVLACQGQVRAVLIKCLLDTETVQQTVIYALALLLNIFRDFVKSLSVRIARG